MVGLPLKLPSATRSHAAQHCADHRHADLDNLSFAGLQRIEGIDTGRIGARNRRIEPLLFVEAAFQRDGYGQHVDGADHADLEFHQILRFRRQTGQHQRSSQHQYAFHYYPPSFIGPTLVTQ